MKLALFIADLDVRINQQIALGLSQELQRHGPWQIIRMPEDCPLPTFRKTICKEKPDAVFIRTSGKDIRKREFLESLSLPIVLVAANEFINPCWPLVLPDDEAIGIMAADYLLAQRFDNIALMTFAGIADGPRAVSFRERIRQGDKHLDEFPIPTRINHPASHGSTTGKLLRWLKALPKPCGMLVHSDRPGAYIVRLCAKHGIQVPGEISVLGVDDDALFCQTVYPNLSSVHVPNAQIGTQAARLILDWKPGNRIIKVQPATVIERDSIRSPAINDPLVNIALDHLREHAGEGVRAADLQKLTGLTPQLLVYRFRAAIDRTPMEMILKERINLACKLLHETDKPIAQIASLCGFKSANQFFVTFRNGIGMSPKIYREQFRAA